MVLDCSRKLQNVGRQVELVVGSNKQQQSAAGDG